MERQYAGRGASVTVNSREAESAASYIGALRADSSLARASDEHLRQGQAARSLVFQGRMLCSVLRPRFITERRAAELGRVSAVLASLCERAGDYLLQSDRHLDLVGASELEREVWAIDPGYPGLTLTSRLDSFMVEDRPRFVEYNAESPASIGFCDALSEVFEELPAMTAWPERGRLRRFETRSALLDTLLWAYRAWGSSDVPRIAIIDWETVSTRRDFELCGEFFRAAGCPTVICDPRRFTYEGGKLLHDGEHITLVYRRVLLHELLDRVEEAQPLLRAYREGAVCMVNSPRSKLLHKKALFALLSDRRLGLEMTEAEGRIVDDTIPWTRLVVEGETTYEGSAVNLVTLLLANPERFALKPVDDYAGRGVVLGWNVPYDVWERAVEEALAKPYVVQERVDVPAGEFPIWRNDGTETVSMLVDTDPLLFRGEMRGILTRISADPLLNVSAGTGSTTPTFVVTEEES